MNWIAKILKKKKNRGNLYLMCPYGSRGRFELSRGRGVEMSRLPERNPESGVKP